MSGEQDSRVLDHERTINDQLRAENLRLCSEIEQLRFKHEHQFRRMRDIMVEP